MSETKEAEEQIPFDFKVTINGVDYMLGAVAGNVKNVGFFNRAMAIDDDLLIMKDMEFFAEFQRVLREAITNGESAEIAEEAISNMRFRFSEIGPAYNKLVLSFVS